MHPRFQQKARNHRPKLSAQVMLVDYGIGITRALGWWGVLAGDDWRIDVQRPASGHLRAVLCFAGPLE
jgi:hypothetical protein